MSADPLDAEPLYLDMPTIAKLTGVKATTIGQYLSRGDMPEPDLVWHGRKLWLPSTIEAWQANRRKRPRAAAIPARLRVRTREGSAGHPQPPRLVSGEFLAERGPPAKRYGVSEERARELALTLRAAGVFCTTADVRELTLAVAADLPSDRLLLRQRILAEISRSGASAGA